MKRGIGFVGALGGSAMVLWAAAAFACVVPATVNLSTASGRPGEVITVSGSSWKMPENATSGIQVRWGSPNGPLLSEVRSDEAGNFSTTVTIPDGPPGFYAVTVVLRDGEGNDVSGTPGRALFEIRTAAAPPPPEPVAGSFTPSADDGGSSFPIALVAALGTVGLVLFTGGFVAVTRSRKAPAPSAVHDRR